MRLILLSFVALLFCACTTSESSRHQMVDSHLNPPPSGETVEVLLLGDKFQSTKGSKAYIYDANFYIVVAKEDVEYIESRIESHMARIRQGVSEAFAKASPQDLHDPDRTELKQAILNTCTKYLGKRLNGGDFVQSVIITDWKRFSSDL